MVGSKSSPKRFDNLYVWVRSDPHSTSLTSTVTAVTSESGAQLSVMMCQIQHRLWHACGLHDTADLDRAFFLDEFADGVQEIG